LAAADLPAKDPGGCSRPRPEDEFAARDLEDAIKQIAPAADESRGNVASPLIASRFLR
jgi:hypothetical protein